jgi:hypothetical protein
MSKVGRPMGKLHQDDVRSKIQVSQLVNVLTNHALGKDDRELVPTRLKAIEILLKKSLPDLSAIEHSGPNGGPQQHEHEWTVNLVRAKPLDT